MSTPEHAATDSNPEKGPAAGFESTSLWPIDDPEQTSHILRPASAQPATNAPAAAEPPTQAPTATPVDPAIDPEATTVAPSFGGGNYTQPWASTTPAAPAAPPPGYGPPATPPPGYGPPATPHGQPGYYQQAPQPGGYPQGTGYQQAPGYPSGGATYPPGPSYAHQPQPNHPTVGESPTGPVDFTPKGKSHSGRRRTVVLIGAGAAVAVIAAVGVTGFWKPGFFITRQLNITKVAEGVQHILTDPSAGYGITGVSGLLCNNGQNPSGDQGTKFSCTLTVNGAKHNVEITVVDDHGTYQVGKVT
jgi:hypothetical protein